jgi:hypothetical protein
MTKLAFPPDWFKDSLVEKKIYYFTSTTINSDKPHHYICVKRRDDNVLIMSLCTSKFDTVKKFVESRGLPNETLVYVRPEPLNEDIPFDKETYVNCNNVHTFSVDELVERYTNGSVSLSGEIPDSYYHQIVTGLLASPLIAEEIKSELPSPDSI